ncbi:dihydroorotate dehydrogenase electron transfer subunit [Thiogranum longum]
MSTKPHRETICLEAAKVIAHHGYEGNQHILRVEAPDCAARATAGQFAHLTCDPMLAMRRPLSIMRVDAQRGWVDFLYKVTGHGTRLLANRKPGDFISLLGPIGQPFRSDPSRPRVLLLGGGVGMPPMIFLAEQLKQHHAYRPLVLLASEVPFPFSQQPSRILVPGVPEGVISSMPLLEDWGIPSRLASLQGYPGCYSGYITDLARCWLDGLDERQLAEVEIFACGPQPMLRATAALAKDYRLPCQVSLEEFMACAVGGCAGCVVEVKTAAGPAMKRVCVDGPVFDAYSVFSS